MTTQNQDYVDDFKDIYGGRLVVDAQVCYLDPVLDITFESDNPKSHPSMNRDAFLPIVRTGKDYCDSHRQTTQETRRSQMIVNVISKLG